VRGDGSTAPKRPEQDATLDFKPGSWKPQEKSVCKKRHSRNESMI
jgi:hypothetical protein